MKRTVLIKEGEYRPSLFADFVETVNQPEAEQIGFYSRHDYTFRLTRNRSTLEPSFPLAIAHYNVDVANPIQDPALFRPIDTELMYSALEEYDYVIFGVITPTHLVTDQSLFKDAVYLARDADNKLINVGTSELIQPDGDKVTFVTAFFGVVRMKGLPVYNIILNSTLTHVTDGFDYRHKQTDTLYSLVTDHDGTIKDTVFAPSVSGATIFGNTLLANKPTINITFFSHPSVLRDVDVAGILTSDVCTIETDMEYTINENTITLDTCQLLPVFHGPRINYVTVTFHCGTFFDVASIIEQPTFKFLVITP